jgi:hypothetical protein
MKIFFSIKDSFKINLIIGNGSYQIILKWLNRVGEKGALVRGVSRTNASLWIMDEYLDLPIQFVR